MRQYLVIGAGPFGLSVSSNLEKKGNEVLLVDKDEEALIQGSVYATSTVVGDIGNEKFIKALGVRNFDVIIMAFATNIANTMFIATLLKEAGAPYIIAKAKDQSLGKLLTKVGVDQIIYPERDMGKRIADTLNATNVLDHIELSEDYGIVEIKVDEKWVGRSLEEIDFRKNYGLNIIAIKENNDMNPNPNGLTRIYNHNRLIAFGRLDKLSSI